MVKNMSGVTAVRLGSLMTVCAGFLLAGCQYDPILEDNYQPASVSERYPIRVQKAPVKTGIRAPSGSLSDEQKNAVVNFATEAKRAASSRVGLKFPSGSRAAREVAQTIGSILTQQGIPASMIAMGSYPGGSAQPILLSFERKVAVTKECGDWSENLGSTYSNEPYPNFGCSIQHNIAAIVASPEDFERPRATGPVLAGNRTEAMNIFVANSTAGDYWTSDGSKSTGK